MSRCPRVLSAVTVTVPVQYPWWGGSTPRPLREASPSDSPPSWSPWAMPQGTQPGGGL